VCGVVFVPISSSFSVRRDLVRERNKVLSVVLEDVEPTVVNEFDKSIVVVIVVPKIVSWGVVRGLPNYLVFDVFW
jgi:hypothetical protein